MRKRIPDARNTARQQSPNNNGLMLSDKQKITLKAFLCTNRMSRRSISKTIGKNSHTIFFPEKKTAKKPARKKLMSKNKKNRFFHLFS